MASFANIATRRLGLLETLRSFFVRVLNILSAHARNSAKTVFQIAGIGVISFGIGLIYLPAALIFAGLVAVIAIEVR